MTESQTKLDTIANNLPVFRVTRSEAELLRAAKRTIERGENAFLCNAVEAVVNNGATMAGRVDAANLRARINDTLRGFHTLESYLSNELAWTDYDVHFMRMNRRKVREVWVDKLLQQPRIEE